MEPESCNLESSIVKQKCQFSCADPKNFKLIGSKSVKCKKNSTWRQKGGNPMCVEKKKKKKSKKKHRKKKHKNNQHLGHPLSTVGLPPISSIKTSSTSTTSSTTRSQSFTSLMADLCQDINREFLHLAGGVMEHFLEGIAPLRY